MAGTEQELHKWQLLLLSANRMAAFSALLSDLVFALSAAAQVYLDPAASQRPATSTRNHQPLQMRSSPRRNLIYSHPKRQRLFFFETLYPKSYCLNLTIKVVQEKNPTHFEKVSSYLLRFCLVFRVLVPFTEGCASSQLQMKSFLGESPPTLAPSTCPSPLWWQNTLGFIVPIKDTPLRDRVPSHYSVAF